MGLPNHSAPGSLGTFIHFGESPTVLVDTIPEEQPVGLGLGVEVDTAVAVAAEGVGIVA